MSGNQKVRKNGLHNLAKHQSEDMTPRLPALARDPRLLLVPSGSSSQSLLPFSLWKRLWPSPHLSACSHLPYFVASLCLSLSPPLAFSLLTRCFIFSCCGICRASVSKVVLSMALFCHRHSIHGFSWAIRSRGPTWHCWPNSC